MSNNTPAHLPFWLILIFVGVAFCQPLHVFPLVNFVEELLVTLGVLAGAGVMFYYCRELRLSIWLVSWLILGGLFLLSGLIHPAPFIANKLLMGVFWVAGLFALLIGDQLDWSVNGEQLSRGLAVVLLVAAVVCALGGGLRNYGLLGKLWQFYIPEAFTGRMVGLVGHSNFFAYISFFGLVAGGFLYSLKRLPLWGFLIVMVVLVGGILGSGSRSVLITWLVVLVVLILRRDLPLVKPWLFVLGGAFLFYWGFRPVFFILDKWLSAYAVEHALVIGQGSVITDVVGRGVLSPERLAEWRVTGELIRDNFWTGIGIGNYAGESFRQHLQNGTPSPGGLFLHSHNSPMQLVVELGLAGLLWLLATFFLAAGAFWRASKDATRLMPLLVILAIQVYSLFEFPLWLMHFFVLHMLLLGALGGRACVKTVKLGKLFSGLALFACLVVAVIYVPLAERFNWSYRQYFLREKVSPNEYAFLDVLTRDPMLEPYGYLIYFANFNLSAGLLERERVVLERFRASLPFGQTLLRLALLKQIEGDEDGARAVMSEVRSFYGNAYESVLAEQVAATQAAFPNVNFQTLFLSDSRAQKGVIQHEMGGIDRPVSQ